MSTDLILNDEKRKSLPSFMQGDGTMGTDEMQKFIRPSRLKIVQPQSGEPFKPLFSDGDTILIPEMIAISPVILDGNNKPTKAGQPFVFVPVYFFPEWCTWNPIDLKGQVNAIRERSYDPKSEIAIKSRSEDTREESFPEQPTNPKLSIRHQEHLNFIIVLLEGEAAGMPVIVTFVRSEHKTGATLSSLISMRRAPMFGCIFEATSKYRSNAKGQWYGFDITNPRFGGNFGGGITDEKQYKALKELHLRMKELHTTGALQVDLDDEQVVDSASKSPAM